MPFGIDDAIVFGVMAGAFVYQRYIDPPTPPPPPPPAKSLAIPQTDAGSAYPIFWGRVRVKQAVVAYASKSEIITGSTAGPTFAALPYVYGIDLLLVIGIGFDGGAAAMTVLQMWAGEMLLAQNAPGLVGLAGNGGVGLGFACQIGAPASASGDTAALTGFAEYLNGNASQVIVDGSGTAQTNAGVRMLADGITYTTIAGYRNFASVFLFGPSGHMFWIGASPNVPAFGFEIQSLPPSFLGPNQQVAGGDGDILTFQGDVNPMDVLVDVITGTRGKLGLPMSRLNLASFTAAAKTLDTEGNGYSRVFEQVTSAGDIVKDILAQVDGVLYEDPSTGLVGIRLIRNDYTVSALPVVSPANCTELQNFAASGQTGLPNKILVRYTSRADDYRPNSASAQNMANAVGQDGEVIAVTLDFPSVTTPSNAQAIATRELAARSRTLMKCSAIVDRTFYKTLPGDCVVLNWPEWNLSGIVMRVAAVNRGTLADGKIQLDLIQDYYYVWRGSVVGGQGGGGFPASGGGLRH